MTTEEVSCHSGIELIFSKICFAAYQLKCICRDNDLHIAAHYTNTAITMLYFGFLGHPDFEAHSAAMTSAGDGLKLGHLGDVANDTEADKIRPAPCPDHPDDKDISFRPA